MCVHAVGVDLHSLEACQKYVLFPGCDQELVVGRSAQPANYWETLLPQDKSRVSVSRHHFKIIARDGQEGNLSETEVFYVECLSQNGILLNGSVIHKGSSEQRLHFGDVIGLGIELPLQMPFAVFRFEPAGGMVAGRREIAFDEQHQPPDGSTAGLWHADLASVHYGSVLPADALMSLEVCGDHVRCDLLPEARRIFLCFSPGSLGASCPPALRIGRRYQRDFWGQVLDPDCYASGCWAFMAADHFAIYPNQPRASTVPGDWAFRLRVLGPAEVTINSTIVITCGEEYQLRPQDTLKVETRRAPTGTSTRIRSMQGLYFVFHPHAGQLGICQSPVTAQDFPSPPQVQESCQLPEAERSFEHGIHTIPVGPQDLIPAAQVQEPLRLPEVEPAAEVSPVKQLFLPLSAEESPTGMGCEGESSGPVWANIWGAAAAGVLKAPEGLQLRPDSP